MAKYKIDKQLKRYCFNMPFNKTVLRLSRIPLKIAQFFCVDKNIKTETYKIGGNKLPLNIFKSKNAPETKGLIFYIHGGGFGYDAAPCQKRLAFDLAKAGYTVAFPHYRLLPDYVYPTQRQDALCCYEWVCRNYLPRDCKVVIMGDSAGGAIASQLCKDICGTSLTQPCAQMLLYPVIDASCSSDSMMKYEDTPLWNSKNNRAMWAMLFDGNTDLSASPMTDELPAVIPPTYLEAAEYDCLRSECFAYADRLKNSGADVTFVDVKGSMHGYDFARRSDIFKSCLKKRLDFLNSVTK